MTDDMYQEKTSAKLLDYKFKGNWIEIPAARTPPKREACKDKGITRGMTRARSLWRTELRTQQWKEPLVLGCLKMSCWCKWQILDTLEA